MVRERKIGAIGQTSRRDTSKISDIGYAKLVASVHSLAFFRGQLYESDYFAHFVTENLLFSNVSMLLLFSHCKAYFI